MSDIIDRLNEACKGYPAAWPHRLLHDAISEIERLRGVAQEAREPAGWLHQIKEPTDPNTHRMYSASPDNPWGHWQQSYKDQCQYTATALYAGPDSTLSSTNRVCAKCGCETMGEEALVNGVIWCHPCADGCAYSSTLRGDAP